VAGTYHEHRLRRLTSGRFALIRVRAGRGQLRRPPPHPPCPGSPSPPSASTAPGSFLINTPLWERVAASSSPAMNVPVVPWSPGRAGCRCAGSGRLPSFGPGGVSVGSGSGIPAGAGCALATAWLLFPAAGRSRSLPVPFAPGAGRLPLRERARIEKAVMRVSAGAGEWPARSRDIRSASLAQWSRWSRDRALAPREGWVIDVASAVTGPGARVRRLAGL
jgi:hypothetical protein